MNIILTEEEQNAFIKMLKVKDPQTLEQAITAYLKSIAVSHIASEVDEQLKSLSLADKQELLDTPISIK